MSAILIRNGRVVDPAMRVDSALDVLVDDGVIAESAVPGKLDAAAKKLRAEIVDAKGCIVAPGFIDLHVHLREPGQTHKETIRTGTMAAAAGGFTTVCAMPNTTPVNDTPEWTRWMQDAERGASVRVLPVPAATVGSMGEKLTDYAALKRAGAVAVSDDGKPILGDAIMRACLVAAAKVGLPVSQHAEDTRLTGGCSMHAGDVSFRLGLRGMTIEAESNIVERDIKLVEEIERKEKLRAHLHVQHVSTAKALDAIRAAKKRGLHVTCEVAPHHFALTDEAVAEYDTHAKMNPPLRPESDRQACIAALLDGMVDAIATDHAPHAHHEKNVEFERAPNGITGLETALGLAVRLLHGQYKMPLQDVLRLLTSGPAEVFNLKKLGTLRKGAPADVTIFNASAVWAFDVTKTLSKSRNTPFHDVALQGRILATIAAGHIVYGRAD
jgi:dihydroorotase